MDSADTSKRLTLSIHTMAGLLSTTCWQTGLVTISGKATRTCTVCLSRATLTAHTCIGCC
eukprot:2007986-Pyramimonas_sp.AAC.1